MKAMILGIIHEKTCLNNGNTSKRDKIGHVNQTSFNNKAVADATSAMCKLKDYMYFSS